MEQQVRTRKEKILGTIFDIAEVFTAAIIAIMIIFTFMFRFVGVIGPSMIPTLQENDWLAVSAYSPHPKQGDVVIITQPNAFHEPIVKRVIATGGQKVDIDFNAGTVYVDDVALEEPYVNAPTYRRGTVNFPVTVPKGHLFVLGDNRNRSTDSRYDTIGFVDENYVLGKVLFRILPFGNFQVN